MKNDNRGRDIFMGLVAVATLIVAIIGATLAYFSISDSSEEGAVNAQSTVVSISYEDGQQVTAQATDLIPSSFEVVQNVYIDKVRDIKTTNAANLCIDEKDKEVCSVYRFSISSDTLLKNEVTAMLNNEENGFTYLGYAVYDVTNTTWLELTDAEGDDAEYYLPISSCSNTNDELSNCFNIQENTTIKNYTNEAKNSIFGITGEDSTAKKLESLGSTPQVYDLILFIIENNDNQNIDQGKEYKGTIVVDVTSDTGNITGTYNK